jgi:SAM-dependent methyltransferase
MNEMRETMAATRCVRIESRLCVERDFSAPWLHRWAEAIGQPIRLHRKLWEYAAIVEALAQRGMFGLDEQTRGLGFGVGKEPLPDLFARLGCSVLATDLQANAAGVEQWITSGQHLSGRPLAHDRIVTRDVDMRAIPDDLRGFDFIWSSSSLEHLGSIKAGLEFLETSLRCLRPGGVAVHTTEFNVESNNATLDHGPVVVFRRRDLETLVLRLMSGDGCYEANWESNWETGDGPADLAVDEAPYRAEPHLKLRLGGHVFTSALLVMETG